MVTQITVILLELWGYTNFIALLFKDHNLVRLSTSLRSCCTAVCH